MNITTNDDIDSLCTELRSTKSKHSAEYFLIFFTGIAFARSITLKEFLENKAMLDSTFSKLFFD